MTSLFIRFDLNFFSFQLLILVSILIKIFNFFYKINIITVYLKEFFKFIENFFFSIKPIKINKITSTYFFCLINIIIILNFIGVFPYNFAITSQIRLVIFISLRIWLRFFIFSFKINFKGFIYHFVPEGSPIYLIWFLFLIELVSNFIRPLTLIIRLVANILAGHLLIILLSKLIFIFSFSILFYLILNVVEIFVALIQSYIFTTIICLYFSEV